MNRWAIRSVALGALLTIGIQSQAHHAVAGVYDLNTEIVLEGVLQKLNYRNPHGNLVLAVEEDDGSITEWTLTTPSTQMLIRAGVNRDTIKPGEFLKITALPARNGNPSGFIRRVELSDRVFEIGVD